MTTRSEPPPACLLDGRLSLRRHKHDGRQIAAALATHYHMTKLRTRLPQPGRGAPVLSGYWLSSTWDELWMRPVDVFVDDVIALQRSSTYSQPVAMDAGRPSWSKAKLLPDARSFL